MESAPLSSRELGEVLALALRAGQLMLESGANTARTEETVVRFGRALGAQRLDVYVTPTGIVATADAREEHGTRIVRVVKTGIDLNRVAALSALAERAGTLDRAHLQTELERIASTRRLFGPVLTPLAVGLGCACFALLFGGGPRECVAAGVAAAAGQGAREGLHRLPVGRLVMTFFVAVVTAGLGLLGARVLEAQSAGLTLAASVLLLVPGAFMVSSVADLFRGDTLSGLARGTSAMLVIFTAGAGTSSVLLATGARLTLTTRAAPPLGWAAVLALLATVGFAVLFNVPRRALPLCALVGAAGYLWRHGLPLLAPHLPAEGAMFAGGVIISLLAEPCARALRVPSSIFVIPGFIPLVPGVVAFRTVLELVAQDYPAGTASLMQATLRVASLAAGIGTARVLTRMRASPSA